MSKNCVRFRGNQSAATPLVKPTRNELYHNHRALSYKTSTNLNQQILISFNIEQKLFI